MLSVEREGYRVYQKQGEPRVCVRQVLTADREKNDIDRYHRGWLLVHELLGECAPVSCRKLDDRHLEMEFIPGQPLNEWYGGWLRAPRPGKPNPPWGRLWERLPLLWRAPRPDFCDSRHTVKDLWNNWFAIGRYYEAREAVCKQARERPFWFGEGLGKLLWYKLAAGSYTAPPRAALETFERSRKGLLFGDTHFRNLIGSSERLVLVDFADVAWGPVALDLAPLWFQWWLAGGLFFGDHDRFLAGFRALWNEFVGPEILLVRMAEEWCRRAFSWLLFSFYRHELGLDPQQVFPYVRRFQTTIKTLRRMKAFGSGRLVELREGS